MAAHPVGGSEEEGADVAEDGQDLDGSDGRGRGAPPGRKAGAGLGHALSQTFATMLLIFQEGKDSDFERNVYLPHAHLMLLLIILVVMAIIIGAIGL